MSLPLLEMHKVKSIYLEGRVQERPWLHECVHTSIYTPWRSHRDVCVHVTCKTAALLVFVLERVCSGFIVASFKQSENPPLGSEE